MIKLNQSKKGFASVEHSMVGFQVSDLTKIDVLINNNKIDALSMIVHKSFSNRKAREIAKNLQKLIPVRCSMFRFKLHWDQNHIEGNG